MLNSRRWRGMGAARADVGAGVEEHVDARVRRGEVLQRVRGERRRRPRDWRDRKSARDGAIESMWSVTCVVVCAAKGWTLQARSRRMCGDVVYCVLGARPIGASVKSWTVARVSHTRLVGGCVICGLWLVARDV